MSPDSNFSHFAPVLHVKNIEQTISFYESLGFSITFSWNDPIDYVVMKRGEQVAFHFSKTDEDQPIPADFRSVYIFVHDVDALFEEYQSKEIVGLTSPEDRPYGMRDFDLKDINGVMLTFGKEIQKT